MKDFKNTIICPNCESEFDSEFKYCPECGQKNKGLDLNLSHIVKDFLSSGFNIESKLLISLKLLITRPGFLTSEYVKGKRMKYVSPVKLYMLISVVYFFLITIDTGHFWEPFYNDKEEVVIDTVTKADSSNALNADSILVENIGKNEIVAIDTVSTKDEIYETDDDNSVLEAFISNKSKLLESKTGQETFKDYFRKNTSFGMFLLIPFTALILYLLFRKRTFYVQHLIFSFHVQSVVFLIFILYTIVDWFIVSDIIDSILSVLIIVVPYLWTKKYYKIGYFKALWKMILFGISYFILLLLFFIVVLSLSFALL